MVDIFHFYWILLIAVGLGILGGEIIAELNRKPPKNKKGGGKGNGRA